MKSKPLKLTFLAIIILTGIYILETHLSDAHSCSDTGYTIFVVNGILTGRTDALENSYALKKKLSADHNGEKLIVGYLYNPSHLSGLGDMMDSIRQGIFDAEDSPDYDLREMLTKAHKKIKTQKILLVGHSQGNFYSNSFYKAVADQAGGIPSQSIGVYAVATPSDHVAGNGRYITSDTDKVIAGVVGHLPFKKILKPLDHVSLQQGDDTYGHSFSDVYLKYLSPKIVTDINWSLDRLETNTLQKEDGACITVPKNTRWHQIEKMFIRTSDRTTDAIVREGRSIAKSVYKEGASLITAFKDEVSSVFDNTKKLASQNSALAINSVDSSKSTPAGNSILETQIESKPLSANTFPILPSLPTNNTQIVQESHPVQILSVPVVLPVSGGGQSNTPLPTGGSSNENGGGYTASAQTQSPTGNQTSSPDQNQPSDQQSPDTDNTTVPIVINTTPPTITLTGSSSTSIEKNSEYTDPGAIAVDSAGNPITVTSVSTVNPSIPGTYTITYTATNSSGNTATLTRTVYVEGIKSYFDGSNKISYTGGYLICDVDTHSVYATGNNTGTTSFVSSSNWQTSRMSTANKNMPIQKNFRIIFANDAQAVSDCTKDTRIHDYSDTFHYEASSGSSVITDDGKTITSFVITSSIPTITGIIDDSQHSITVAVPADTDIKAMVPHVLVSPGAVITPASDITQDFTNPVAYTVKAADGSTQKYIAHTVPQGAVWSFDSNNQIAYTGTFVVCYADTRNIYANGNNTSLTNFLSSTNWQTAFEQTPNIYMPVNKNIRFIFGSFLSITADCTQGTYLNPHTNSIYYTTNMGTSVVYGAYTAPADSTPVTPDPISDPVPTPDQNPATPPSDPGITIPDPTLDPAGDISTLPTITSYTLNGNASDIMINPLVDNLTITLSANKNVNWLSVKIESKDDSTFYKIFQSGPLCVDGTSPCTKTWDGILSSGGLLHDGVYRVRVHVKDANDNDYEEYLPSMITVDVPDQ